MEIRIIYLRETLAIHSVGIGDDSISHMPADTYATISGEPSHILLLATVASLDTMPIIDFLNNNNISFNMTPELQSIFKDRAFGIRLCADIVDRVKNLEDLNNTQRLTLLNTIKDGLNSLQWGDIIVSRAAFNAIATTALYTQARKDWVLDQIDNYLNN